MPDGMTVTRKRVMHQSGSASSLRHIVLAWVGETRVCVLLQG